MRKQLVVVLRFFCLLLVVASSGTMGFASTPKYDYPTHLSVLGEQSAAITQAIPELTPTDLQPSLVALFDSLVQTKSSESHVCANAPPRLDNQADTCLIPLQPADATAFSIGQNGQLVAAEGAEALAAGRLSSLFDTAGGLKGINTNVTAEEFSANLQANGYTLKISPNGTNVLTNGNGSTYSIYTRSSTGASGAQYFGPNGQSLKFNLGQ